MKAGIAIDDYKLPTFLRILEAAGYTVEQGPGLTAGTLFLRVETDDPMKLKGYIERANRESSRNRN